MISPADAVQFILYTMYLVYKTSTTRLHVSIVTKAILDNGGFLVGVGIRDSSGCVS